MALFMYPHRPVPFLSDKKFKVSRAWNELSVQQWNEVSQRGWRREGTFEGEEDEKASSLSVWRTVVEPTQSLNRRNPKIEPKLPGWKRKLPPSCAVVGLWELCQESSSFPCISSIRTREHLPAGSSWSATVAHTRQLVYLLKRHSTGTHLS